MPTQPPHHVSSLESQNPDSPKPTANRQKPKAKSCFYETNPISTPAVIPSVGLRSETQRPKVEGPTQSASPTAIPHKQTTPTPKKYETNPITSPLLLYSPSPLLHYSTSAPPIPQLHETNPISAYQVFRPTQKMRNTCRVEAERRRKPNLTPPHNPNTQNEPNPNALAEGQSRRAGEPNRWQTQLNTKD